MERATDLIIGVLFLSLAFLHVYWGVFGIKHPEKVLPQPNQQKKVLPSKTATFVVAIALFLFGLLFILKLFDLLVGDWPVYAQIAIGLLFLARAVGDFKRVGFFKTLKNTPFAKMDSLYYSPLCLLIAILIVISLHTS